jgi:hypothetical protein
MPPRTDTSHDALDSSANATFAAIREVTAAAMVRTMRLFMTVLLAARGLMRAAARWFARSADDDHRTRARDESLQTPTSSDVPSVA